MWGGCSVVAVNLVGVVPLAGSLACGSLISVLLFLMMCFCLLFLEDVVEFCLLGR